MVLDPKINQLLMLELNHDVPISYSGDFYIDFSGDTTIALPDKDTILKTSYEDVTWIDLSGTSHTNRARIEYYPHYKMAFYDPEDGLKDECYCESLL